MSRARDRAESAMGRPIARVLLDSTLPQLDHLFDYSVPDELADDLRVGQRIRVPFRSKDRKSFGYLIEFADDTDFVGELSPIAETVGPVPVLTPEVWSLARAVADRAGGSAGDVLRLAIPSRQVRVEKKHLQVEADVTREAVREPVSLAFEADVTERAIAAELMTGSRLAYTPSHGPERLPTGEWVGGWAVRFARLAIEVHRGGRSAILILPDYRDLDQVRDAIAALGHHEAIRVDSRQSNAERYAGFLRALDPTPRIILGNRSAVYAPAYKLGAIMIWDDGDPLLAEPLTPYVHARDAALVRSRQSGAGLLFAAHTRSAEVQRLVNIGYVKPQEHPPRRTRIRHADDAVSPDAFAGRVPEFAARTIREGLESGPVLVQVAIPGFAPVAVCASCDTRARCMACAGPLGFRTAGRASCRWCGEFATAWRCAECDGTRLEERGMGADRTVDQFERQFAGARVFLSDGEHPRERVDARPSLVVATRGAEPLAAGGYRAVVLLDAERLLGLESLRAAEDCLRWWENAAAMAAPDGICLMASGGGPVIRAFVTGRTEEWLQSELRDRRALKYPPAVRVASVTGTQDVVERALATLDGLPGIDWLGPAPHPQAADDSTAKGTVRAIVRFNYSRGAEVASRLRGALVADAAGSASRIRPRGTRRPRAGSLRLRFDDRGVFDG